MAQDDWYRGTAWDPQTQELFEQKLRRARERSRAQYLRIKGCGLTSSDSKRVRRSGRDLLRRVLGDHPSDVLQVVFAHADLGQSLARDGLYEEALEHYRAAMRGPDNIESGAALGFAEAVLEARRTELYDEALRALTESDASRDPFAATRFRWNLSASRLASRRGAPADARELARVALRCLEETQSPFPRHRRLGLASADAKTIRELRRLAAA